MSFTDKELEHLKNFENEHEFFLESEVYEIMEMIPTLLERLEAAEACIGYNVKHSEWESRYEAWRKAAGK